MLDTSCLQGTLPWVKVSLHPIASDRGRRLVAMLFWIIAALAVVGALVLVVGLYLLASRRHWL